MFVRRLMMTSFLLLIGSTFCWAGTIDSGLFTTYSGKTTLDWVVSRTARTIRADRFRR